MTRARERLILSGGTDPRSWPEPRPGGPPIDWIAAGAASASRRAGASASSTSSFDGRPTRVLARLVTPGHASPPDALRRARARGRHARHRAARQAEGRARRRRPAGPRRSGSQLHRARPVRQLRLPLLPRADPSDFRRSTPPFAAPEAAGGRGAGPRRRASRGSSPTACSRSSTSPVPRRPRRRRSPRSPRRRAPS